MAKNVITPFEKKRQALLQDMTPPCRKVAEFCDKKLKTAARGMVLIRYDIGVRIRQMNVKEAEYGSDAVNQVAAYLDFPGGSTGLYALMNMSEAFDRTFVEQEVDVPMSNGRALDTRHFILLSRLKTKASQEELLKKVRAECLSTNELEAEIQANYEQKNSRSGGRKPKNPSTPEAGLQKLYAQSHKLDNYLKMLKEELFGKLTDLPPDRVNSTLVEKFELAYNQLNDLIEDSQGAAETMSALKERLENVMRLQQQADTEPADEAEEEAAPAPRTRRRATKKAARKKATSSQAQADSTPTTKKTVAKSKSKKTAKRKKTTAKGRRPAAV